MRSSAAMCFSRFQKSRLSRKKASREEKSFLMKSEMIEKEFFKDGAFHHVFFELFSRTTDTRAGRLVARFHCLL